VNAWKQLWSEVQGEGIPAPRPDRTSSWPLAPHLDLHMQLPPQQLLQLVAEAAEAQREREQEQPESAEAPRGMQQLAAGDASVPAAPAVPLSVPQRHGLDMLLKGLRPAFAVHAAVQKAVNSSSSSSTSAPPGCGASRDASGVTHMLQALWRSCPGSRPQQGGQAEADEVLPVGSVDDVMTIMRGLGDAAAGQSREPAAGVLGFRLEVAVHVLWLLVGLIISKFLVPQWRSSAGGSSASWQQAVPMQMLLLLSLAEQAHAAATNAAAASAAGRSPPHRSSGLSNDDGKWLDSDGSPSLRQCHQSRDGSNTAEAAGSGACSACSSQAQLPGMRDNNSASGTGTLSQQQQQRQQQPGIAQQAPTNIAGGPREVVDKVLELLQTLRHFQKWNADFDAAGGGGGSGSGLTAAPLSSDASSQGGAYSRALAPDQLFASSGPLSGSVSGCCEPPGLALWASTSTEMAEGAADPAADASAGSHSCNGTHTTTGSSSSSSSSSTDQSCRASTNCGSLRVTKGSLQPLMAAGLWSPP